MLTKERDKITDILKENGFNNPEIKDYCFEFLRDSTNREPIMVLIDELEEQMKWGIYHD